MAQGANIREMMPALPDEKIGKYKLKYIEVFPNISFQSLDLIYIA